MKFNINKTIDSGTNQEWKLCNMTLKAEGTLLLLTHHFDFPDFIDDDGRFCYKSNCIILYNYANGLECLSMNI